jgi:antitoxin component of MazEF toxin-antitoxin module
MEVQEDIRKVFEIGGCLAIVLPKEYVKAHRLKKGDVIRVYYDDYLHLKPIRKDELAKKLEQIKVELDKEQ